MLNMTAFASEKGLVLFFISEQQNAYITSGCSLSREEVEEWVFLDSFQGARKRHWRGMADQLVPNPCKAPTERKVLLWN